MSWSTRCREGASTKKAGCSSVAFGLED
jgi:hypothetical protein